MKLIKSDQSGQPYKVKESPARILTHSPRTKNTGSALAFLVYSEDIRLQLGQFSRISVGYYFSFAFIFPDNFSMRGVIRVCFTRKFFIDSLDYSFFLGCQWLSFTFSSSL